MDGQPVSGARSPDLVAFRNVVLGTSNNDRALLVDRHECVRFGLCHTAKAQYGYEGLL